MAHKMRIPVARCPACGQPTRDFELINRRCEQMRDGARCRGIVAATHSYDDWQPCPLCEATGRLDAARCGHCGGDGWLFARNA